MFNLLVGLTDGTVTDERVLEYTEADLRTFLRRGGELDRERVLSLPTLLMPEVGDTHTDPVARIGHIENLGRAGRLHRFRFVPNPAMPTFSTEQIATLANDLGVVDPYEFRRTHWAVKDVDLYRVIQQSAFVAESAPTAFRLPTHLSAEPDLVAVMMPFSSEFTSVYQALQDAAATAGMRCVRADDIWKNEHIMDDVIGLIWQARVVVSDLSGRNSNVFYETGIAHTLGRDVLLITQSLEDVPFDLRSIRAVTYHNNGEGRQTLQGAVTGRLRTLTAAGRGAH